MAERHLTVLPPLSPSRGKKEDVKLKHRARVNTHYWRRRRTTAAAPAERLRPAILLVEDDQAQQSLVSTLLEAEGYEVFIADNGKEGLHVLDRTPVDLIVCDMMMPEMGGVEFVQRIRGEDDTANVPVVMLTSIAGQELEFNLLQLGIDVFCPKTEANSLLLRQVRLLLL